jgi:hypothetical protein
MDNFIKMVLGLSIVASSTIFADGGHNSNNSNHMGDHMHNGKMSNHMN